MIRYATQKDENAIYELLCELEGMSLDKEGFHEAYHIAREAGCVRFEVSTNRTRLGAHRFYEREGMERSHYRFIRYFSIEK